MNKKQDSLESEAWINRLRLTMANLDQIEMDEEDRKVIWRCITSEFANATERAEKIIYTLKLGTPWTEEDDNILRDFLQERKPNNRNHHEISNAVEELALKLSRKEKSITTRAIKLGLRRFVEWDYYSHGS